MDITIRTNKKNTFFELISLNFRLHCMVSAGKKPTLTIEKLIKYMMK